jgi:hypothetical protein
MAGPFYFSWTGPGGTFGAANLVEQETVFAIEIRHAEGDFPTLQIDLVNPRVGLLSAGRNRWCWLSYQRDPLTFPIPIFRGRLVGVPENLQDEVVRLEFIARPVDYKLAKIALADTMKLGSFWDPVWLKDKMEDADTVLESYPRLWHIDRVTLEVTASDIINGEDGTVAISADDHFYDAMTVTYGQTPLNKVEVTGTVTWDQKGTGHLDLTNELVTAFQSAGSPLTTPLICSLTGDGLKDSWPAAGTSIGGGWSLGLDSSVETVDWIKKVYYKKSYSDQDPFPDPPDLDPVDDPIDTTKPSIWLPPSSWGLIPANYHSTLTAAPIKTFGVTFPMHTLIVHFSLDWEADRKRSEIVKFALVADIQPIVVDAGDDDVLKIDYTSDTITDGIDPGGFAPLDEPKRSSYFKTTRGRQSFEYLVLVARAKLLSRARCVLIKFVTTWDFVIDWISCRYNVALEDPRLPDGGVVGKITHYVLSYSTDRVQAEVTIACTVGRGGSVSPAAGTSSYFAPGYTSSAYGTFLGKTVSLIPGDIVYDDFDSFTITDDGIDLFNLVATQALSPTLAVTLSTTANVTLHSTALRNLADTTDLIDGVIYAISGGDLAVGTTLTYNGGGAGTLSIAAVATNILAAVTITGVASNGILVINGPAAQTDVIDAAVATKVNPDPIGALKLAATKVCLNIQSLTGGSFETTFDVNVSPLQIPMTVNLEAP